MYLLLAQANINWYLLPLAAAISLAYNASRYEDAARILAQGAKMFVTILLVMAVILGVLYALSYNL